MRQFGTGIVEILNKGEDKDEIGEDFMYVPEQRNTGILLNVGGED